MLGMSSRNRDNLLLGEPRKSVQQIVADKLHDAGCTLRWVSALDSNGQCIWIVDAHSYEKRFIIHADKKFD